MHTPIMQLSYIWFKCGKQQEEKDVEEKDVEEEEERAETKLRKPK